MENNQEIQNKNAKVKKVLFIVLNCLYYLVIVLLLVFAISNLAGKDSRVPKLFGYNFMSVASPSMDGTHEDSFKEGDLIVTKTVNEKILDELKVGDIITFIDYDTPKTDENPMQLNTHRIVDVIELSNGTRYFITQGDIIYDFDATRRYEKGKDESNYQEGDIQNVGYEQVQSVYSSTWKGFGKTINFLRSNLGFGLCIVLPTGLLLAFEAYLLIKNYSKLNKQKMEKALADKEEEQKALLEAEKEKMRQELLAEMAKKEENKEENK